MPPISALSKTDLVSTALGTEQALQPTWYTQETVTPAQAKAICNLHLTAAYLDWAGVPFNQAIRQGILTMAGALGIKVVRITNWSLNQSGFPADLAAVLPLHPDLIMTGGPVSPEEFGAIMQPAIAQGAYISTWALGATTWKTGQNEPLKAVVGYDFYNLGLQLAAAVHQAYPNGATVGYIHWINNALAIINREQGFLAGLKAYPNIHVVTQGGCTPNPAGACSGFANPTAGSAETYAQTFLSTNKNVNVLFAPWEDAAAIGEASAVTSLKLQNKVHIVTMDLSNEGAYQISHGGIIQIDMAEDMFGGGEMMLLSDALAKIGQDKHPFVLVPDAPTEHNNVRDAWVWMHGPNIPCPGTDCG
jgi:ABC-type sugar transport system substrate-binding protein